MLETVISLNDMVEDRRLEANGKLNPKTKSAQGQFMTSRPVAQFMASLFAPQDIGEVRLLDAGAGVGSLTAAFVKAFCSRSSHIKRIATTAYETDHILAEYLQDTFADCADVCRHAGIPFHPQLIQEDFISAGADQVFMGGQAPHRFTHAILNPPYKKINNDSDYRRRLRSIGVETVNLYTGFLAIVIKLLEPGGELVAIVPRSFCNGPYYRSFRELLLEEMALSHIHIFESRTHAFKDDQVLQENIIFYAVKGRPQGQVMLSQSLGVDFAHMKCRTVDSTHIVNPSDPERFIHLTVSEDDQRYVEVMNALPCTLADLGIDVSTGPVVDFRLADYLRDDPQPGTFPLIYPLHCRNHFVAWPMLGARKPNAIINDSSVLKWLYPNGYYAVVRRFSSKAERRRVVATIHDPHRVPGESIGFENHLNIFHRNRQGLTPELARGLAVYLNSTLYDVCFRQFNGHTQVNVKDLYNLRYPNLATLKAWGRRIVDDVFPTQADIDAWVEKELP